MGVYEKLLSRSGGYSLPYLVRLYSSNNAVNLRFVNATQNITYEGAEYLAASLSYTPSSSPYGFDGGGKLEISTKENGVLSLAASYQNIYMEVIGVMNEGGDITPIKGFSHKYGNITTDRDKISFSYDADDRVEMTFPSLIYSTYNNRGNA